MHHEVYCRARGGQFDEFSQGQRCDSDDIVREYEEKNVFYIVILILCVASSSAEDPSLPYWRKLWQCRQVYVKADSHKYKQHANAS